MQNPGVFSLTKNGAASDLAVAAAGTTICDLVDSLDGMKAVSLQARLAYGSGGTTIKAFVQTSLDQGATWVDVACFAFTTAGATKIVNLSAMTPKTTPAAPTDGALADDTCVDGIFGDRLRCKAVSVGVYGGSTVLSVRASVR